MPKPKKNEAKQDFLKRCTGELVANEGKDADQAYALCNVYWDNDKSQRQALTLAAPLETYLEADQDGPGFLITAYTGKVIARWWGNLIIDVAGIKTKTKFPVLREHERNRVVGFAAKSWKDGQNLLIKGDFSKTTQDGAEVQALAGEGFPWQASIGVWPKKVKVLESDKETIQVNGQELAGPLEVWTESEVKEVSFVTIGADDNTAAISFSEGPAVKVQIDRGNPEKIKEEHTMALSLEVLEQDAPELLREIREAARQEGVQQERGRITEILEADGDAAVSRQAIKDGISAADCFKLFFRAEKAKQAAALKSMEDAAPQSQGQTPVTPQPQQRIDPGLDLADKAAVRMNEKKITYEQAMLEVAQENPDLVAKWNPAAGLQ